MHTYDWSVFRAVSLKCFPLAIARDTCRYLIITGFVRVMENLESYGILQFHLESHASVIMGCFLEDSTDKL